MYAKFLKRPLDFILSLCAILALSPLLLFLTVVGAFAMKGNPFFTQLRPGKDEKIFKLIKFRTMTCETDENGKENLRHYHVGEDPWASLHIKPTE